MIRKVANVIRSIKILSSWYDIIKFWQVKGGLIKRKTPILIRVRAVNDFPLLIRPGTSDIHVFWDTFSNKYHLPPFQLGPEPVILDLGANVGYTAAHLATLYPNAKVFAYEMDHNNYEIAKQNLFHFPHAKIFHAAVWGSDGSVGYDSNSEAWGFHIINDGGEKICAKSMQTIICQNSLKKIDYVKMDVEGAEANILESDCGWLQSVMSIKIELHQCFNPKANFENCMKILKEHDFECKKDQFHKNCLIAYRSC